MKKVGKRVFSLVLAMAIVFGMICINKADVDAASTISDGEYYVLTCFTKTFKKKNGYLIIKMNKSTIDKSDEYRNVNRTEMKVKISNKCKCYFKTTNLSYTKVSKPKRTTFKKIQKRVQYNRKMYKTNFSKVDTMGTRIVVKNGQVVKIVYTKGFVGAS
ncbi:MAG: hypothetical protein K6F55_07825 [Eubacterium sp.]|nr:hypothetical protein [Eubacterium sp.]